MTILIQENSVYRAWASGVEYLLKQKDGESTNVILNIKQPCQISSLEKDKIADINLLMNAINVKTSISTVANTIFPQNLYAQYGRPTFYKVFHERFALAKERNTWGTYFERMTCIGRHKSGIPINQLELTINKLIAEKTFKSVYEVSIIDPELDYAEIFSEICTYDPIRFGKVYRNMPCLSHLTFKVISGKLTLTAIYRSHYYGSKALGNLVGLAQLLNFVSKESGIHSGEITCISTFAKLDANALGGKNKLMLSL